MNRRLISERCRAAGTAVHEVAKRAGLDPIPLLFGENPHEDDRMPFGVLRTLSRLLDVSVDELMDSDPTPAADPADDVRLEAALAAVPDGLTRDALSQGLGWPLERVERTVASLEARLRATGRRIRRVGSHAYVLGPNLSVLTSAERARLQRADRKGDAAADYRATEMVFGIVSGWRWEAYYEADPDSIQILREQCLVESHRNQLDISADVAFSLQLDQPHLRSSLTASEPR